MTTPRVVCVGANQESLVVLQTLVAAGARPAAVVTTPPHTSLGACDYVDLHPYCAAWGVPVVDVRRINAPDAVQALAAARPDYLYVLGWSQLLGEAALGTVRHDAIGSHPSALPYGRGRAPIPWAILEDARELAVSLFRLAPGADAGEILVQRKFLLPRRPYAREAYDRVAQELAQAFLELYRAHAAGVALRGTPQDERRATYRAKRTWADGWLDFRRPAADVERLVRAVSAPYPGAYFYVDDLRVTAWRAAVVGDLRHQGACGQVLRVDQDSLYVQTGDGVVRLWDLTVGGQPLPAGELPPGRVLGLRVEDELFRLRAELAALTARFEASEPAARQRGAA
jgi:methionyl-tRNA formyltransferase